MVVTNDKYELPLYVADSFGELAEWLSGIGVHACKNSFRKSTTGIVKSANKKVKYLRINSETGAVIIGPERQRAYHTRKTSQRVL